MRWPVLPLLMAIALGGCHRAATSPTTATRQGSGAGLAARTVAGRAVVRWTQPAQRALWLARLGGKVKAEALGAGEELWTLPGGMDAAGLATQLSGVAEVEPDYVARLGQPEARLDLEAQEPGNTQTMATGARQYALAKVRAQEAWRVTRGSAKVPVAVIDTGVDFQHPDLQGKVLASESFIGLGARLGLGSAKDDNGHGTHCAGVLAAEGQIQGMAPASPLIVVKALDRNGSGAMSEVAKGLRWAVARGAKVVSLSLGSPDDARPLRQAVAEALAAGVVVVAAMGNEGKALRNYPAAYPGVIAVGATTRQDKLAAFSTRGPWISLCAPGSSILSTAPTYPVALTGEERNFGPLTGTLSGTSMATPLVAGVAALLLSQHPDWSPSQVKARLEESAVALRGLPADGVGHGRLDAGAALR